MPTDKSAFPGLYPCDFYTPDELFEPDRMYTVYEVARLLQGLEPNAEIDESTEEVLLDWAIPWVMTHADELVVAEPRHDDEPGHYGLKNDEGAGEATDASDATGENAGEATGDAEAAGDADGTEP
ncbi:hypothetical protein BRC97_02230 [Halobacteriales archaeon QS_6_71_20]|nr:MAG: hypothetical protein BRC97_02230 [Halobacteriales archaeon QS_6_71_20]